MGNLKVKQQTCAIDTNQNLNVTQASILRGLEKIDASKPPMSQVSKKMEDLKLIDAYIEKHRDLLLKLAK
ncbi:hypothetical protein [Candidatus Magnetobacterium casense]|uniref:Uncharacterized protein n=1 Tax=Candidatus Magnetobacterium casense TaxID=1455061 RepID=A0ABS6RZT6_9BACT|nr:hypothetical protein [Candidatus Magnetobacterium casensis]MBV6342121.1 hypothetical protein [Candidatus Magnetobacterium casensis]